MPLAWCVQGWVCVAYDMFRSTVPVCCVYIGLARTVYTHRIWPYVWWFPCQIYRIYTVYTYKCMVLAKPMYTSLGYCGHKACVGLARTVYAHRIWPYVWWSPCLKRRIYTVYTCNCMVLANPMYTQIAIKCSMPLELYIRRFGQNRIYTYIYTVYLVYLVIFKPKIPYVHRIYMVLANPITVATLCGITDCFHSLCAMRVVPQTCRVGQNHIYIYIYIRCK